MAVEDIKQYTENYRCEIIDVHDPERAGRVRLKCPVVLGKGVESNWSPVILPPNFYSIPKEGTIGWCTFRDGDPDFPIFTGIALQFDGKNTPKKFRDWSEGPYKTQLKDAKEHASDPFDNLDHKATRGHNHPPYYDPYVHMFNFPQGANWGVNEEPGEQETWWQDRIGQGFRTVGDPTKPKDPHLETRNAQQFKVTELDNASNVRKKEGKRSIFEIVATHAQKLKFSVRDKDGEEEISLENKNIRNDRGGQALFSNLLSRNEFKRFVPGKELILDQVLSATDPNKASQRLYNWDGLEIKLNSAPTRKQISVRTPGGENTIWDNIKGSYKTQTRHGNSYEMSSSGIKENSYLSYNLSANTSINEKANTTFKAEANITATMKGNVSALVQGGVKADVKAPLVGLGMAPAMGVAYTGSLVTTPFGPAFVTLGSLTVKTTV